jgi:serine/threonine protein phosphatase PrpC
MSLRHCSDTNVGLRRSVNQDAILADASVGLFVVADGMGGHERGEVAADIVVTSIAEFVRAAATDSDTDLATPAKAPAEAARLLRAAILLANRRISDQGGDSTGAGMGATAVAAMFAAGRLVLAHVGDCRAYLLDESGWRAVTQDHSWIADQVAAGLITATAARQHPWRNVVSRAVQGQDSLEVDTVEIELRGPGRLLLCSDGLHAVVEDEEVQRLVADDLGPFDTVSARLIGAALERGAPDNVSAIVVDWPGSTGR